MADTTKTVPGSVKSFVVGICYSQKPLCLLGKHSVEFSYQLSAFPQDPLPQKRLTRTGQWLACSSLPFLFLGPHHALYLYLHLSAAFVLQISDEKYNGQKKISWQIEKLVAAETTKNKKLTSGVRLGSSLDLKKEKQKQIYEKFKTCCIKTFLTLE